VADWRWLFFINVIPGVAITVILPLLGKVDEANPAMLKRIDWLHVGSLAVFLGGLQYVLEEGPRHEWFTDVGVATSAWLSVVGGVVFFERSFFSKMPVLKLTAFLRPTFAMACVLNLVIGFGLYSATYLAPVFLGRVRDYTSLQIGGTVFVTGLTMGLAAPIAARLSTLIDGRYVIAVGFTLFATGLWMFSYITPQWGFWELFAPQAVRGFAVLLCIVPAVGMALNGVVPSELRYASGLFNLMRNLGGAIGIAVVNTWLQDFSRVHVLRLSEAMSQAPDKAAQVMQGLTAYAQRFTTDPARALGLAESQLARIVGQQAMTLAFADVFRLMAWCFIAALVIVPFCKPAPTNAPPPTEH
jgi:DHA2 family multidrug resistance protein